MTASMTGCDPQTMIGNLKEKRMPTATTPTPATRTSDPELTAMSRIAKLLAALEPAVRKRVVAWLNEREKEVQG